MSISKQIPVEKPSITVNQSQNTFIPPTTTSITTKLMNQMKNLTVSSAPTTNVTLTSAIQSSSTSYLNEYEITDLNTKSTKTIAAFPPRPLSSKSPEYEMNTSTPLNEDEIRFGNTPGPQTTSNISPMYDKTTKIYYYSFLFQT